MQSERLNATSRNHDAPTQTHSDLRANQHAKPDTRRFAAIFPVQVPKAVTVDRNDGTHEECDDDSDDPSRWEFVTPTDTNSSTSQIASLASLDQGSTLSAAQQIIACYRAVHGDHAPECATTEIKEETPSHFPDDQRSMYTVATSADTQSTMDMLWRPKPKVHMRRADQRALIQAQIQAISMMNDAGLKPTNKIQCRRRGCADILPDVEALKYHLHIHNIADSATKCNDASPSASHKPSLVECSTSNSKASKRSHFRSKSSLGTQQKCSANHSLPRKLSAGNPVPSLFSPRGSNPEVPNVSSLTAVSKALVSDPGPSKSSSPLPARNNDVVSSTHTSPPSRGRRTRKESLAIAVGTECTPTIAMLLSPPSSPNIHSRLVLTPHTNMSLPLSPNPAMEGENENCVLITNKSAQSVFGQLAGSRSPVRALSPARAMSPIRNGIRRVLSIGHAADFTDK